VIVYDPVYKAVNGPFALPSNNQPKILLQSASRGPSTGGLTMTGGEAQLLARAAELDETSELAMQVIGILGGARAARLDPDALTSLTGTAIALGGAQAAICGTHTGPHLADQRTFNRAVADAEDAIAEWLAAAFSTQAKTQDALAAARGDLAAAQAALAAAEAALAAAQSMPARDKDEASAQAAAMAAAAAAVAAAHARITDAERRIALCEQALAVLGPRVARLTYALQRIRCAPSDVAETYECMYRLVRTGRHNADDGDWVTGEQAL
jgi:hypothetical protein